jgi:hypothetical protein
MKHITEEDLVAYRDGEAKEREASAAHLQECAECRAELERIEAVFAALNAMPVPDPGEDYGQRVWQQIAPRLPEKRPSWWGRVTQGFAVGGWFAPGRLAAVGAVAALVIVAFLVGRVWKPVPPAVQVMDAAKVRERVLVVAVGEHLGRSEMVLVELANMPPAQGHKMINISAEQRRAEDLVEENRLYRETARESGDAAMASTLDELERVLLDVANSPDEVTPARFDAIRKRIEAQGILFKVRVVRQGLDEQKRKNAAAPEHRDTRPGERNKA